MDWLARQVRKRAAAPALADHESVMTWSELAAAAAVAGERLQAHGIGPGTNVLWEAHATGTSLAWLHGAFRVGATILPFRPGLAIAARRALADRSGAAVHLSTDGAALGREAVRDLAMVDPTNGAASGSVPAPVDPERTATLMPTSGSGGPAKLVPLRWRHHEASVRAIRRRLALSADDRWLVCLPLHHIGGLAIVLRAAFTGACVSLHERFDAERVAEALEQASITHASLVPTQLRRIVAALDHPLTGSLRCVLVGGAAAEPELLSQARALGLPVVPTWGMTEAGSQLATPSLAEARSTDFTARPGLVGRPLDGVEVRTAGIAGRGDELQVRAASLFEGYADSPGGPDDDGWFATGDRGVIERDGGLRIIGRTSDRIISGGENVDPRAIERALRDAGLVDEVSVFGVPDAEWGERVAAVVVSRHDVDVLARWARTHLEPHERPRRWRHVERMPQTDSGKPDRGALVRLLDD